ncbi:MAG TPA: 2-hydroxyacid dehydrogenase [Candidatus Acidoferrales bacterium]|nr:2-hydroxyacid dehydrogenase [Candidatus Acidoferrales bacterium]
MNIIFFSAKPFDEEFFSKANEANTHTLTFKKEVLNADTVALAEGYEGVCVSVRDHVDESVIQQLQANGTKLLALRSAGFDHVDVEAAKKFGITVTYVPSYSPSSVAEHTVTLILALNRKIVDASQKTQKYNFSLDGLMGFDLNGKTVGILGTGKIGMITAKILQGFGCKILAYDVYQNAECEQLGIPYVSLDELYAQADIISLHCPLTPETEHIINTESINKMKDTVMIINTARGKLIDTDAVIKGLETGKIGYLGLDVYEHEKGIFFEDKSAGGIQDETLKKLLSLPNVLITAHQASFTKEAKRAIAESILQSATDFDMGKLVTNLL